MEFVVRDSDGYERRFVRRDDGSWWLFDRAGRRDLTDVEVTAHLVTLVRAPVPVRG